MVIDTDIDLEFGTDEFPDKEWAILAGGAIFDNVNIFDKTVSSFPENAYIVTLPGKSRDSFIHASNNDNYRWESWSAASGWSGPYDNSEHIMQGLKLQKRLNRNGRHGQITLKSLDETPDEGNWVRGDFVWNDNPSVKTDTDGGLEWILTGWRCVASGEPGTWHPVWAQVTNPPGL